jgi:hypothetical protein
MKLPRLIEKLLEMPFYLRPRKQHIIQTNRPGIYAPVSSRLIEAAKAASRQRELEHLAGKLELETYLIRSQR